MINTRINILKICKKNFSNSRALRLFFVERKIDKYGFIENIDFVTVSQKRLTTQNNETTCFNHIMKISMAKEVTINREEKMVLIIRGHNQNSLSTTFLTEDDFYETEEPCGSFLFKSIDFICFL